MPRRSFDQLGELQRTVLETLWRLDKATVQQMADALAPDRAPAYTTILTTLQKLERQGWVSHKKSGRAYVYAPRHTRRGAGSNSVRALIDRVFQGDPGLLMESLLEVESLSAHDLERIRAMIEKRRKEIGDA
jgi:predicted transcriptional regulator